MARLWVSTALLWEKEPFSTPFVEGRIFHRKVFLFHRRKWKKRRRKGRGITAENGTSPSVSGCDIGFQLFHCLGKGGIFFHFLLHLVDGIHYRGMVPVVEEPSDVVLREIRHTPDQIHGNLPGAGLRGSG